VSDAAGGGEPEKPESDWERRLRLDRIFGDTEPATTSDEREPAPPPDGEDPGDRWLREQVPPHHG
jgi:hypothetical protein